ncbi:MAG TPA: pyridoxal-phosphate dependent enzyme [Candidatus Limnocylindria bacterium]
MSAAVSRVPAVFRDSPQYVSEQLSASLGRPVVVKVDTVNPVGCFKGRGTWLAVQQLVAGGEVGESRGLVVASAGNFGQGVAYAARAAGVAVTVFASQRASVAKLDAMRRLGAEVRLAGDDFDAARAAAADDAAQRGWRLLVDGEDPWIAIGAGTMAVELTEGVKRGDLPTLAAIYVPVGNGALIAGVGTWLKADAPSTQVIGVQAERAPAMTLSWQQGRPIETEEADTVADGIATRVPIPEALAVMSRTVDDMRLASETDILTARDELQAALPVAVEPSAAVGWAAARQTGAGDGAVAVILSGGNVPLTEG